MTAVRKCAAASQWPGLPYHGAMSKRFVHLLACLRCLALLPFALIVALPANAGDEPVDVELILAVDVSLSMSPGELEIQRAGYAAALTDEAVIKAILEGVHAKIALTYVEWAGDATQRVVVPWQAIASEADARRFAEQITATPSRSARRTSISAAIAYSAGLFENSGFRGVKRVIDISGDGPNNQGGPVDAARDAAVARGITINGLPLKTSGGGFAGMFDIVNLDEYYAECVIGGPGAFVISVNDWQQFPEAVRRKLVMELASGPPAVEPRVVETAAEFSNDCLIGEKIWQSRGWIDWQ